MPWRKAYEAITGVVGVGRLQEGADEVKDSRMAVGKEGWECRVARRRLTRNVRPPALHTGNSARTST